MRQTWLIFSQATTVALAGYFVVSTLKPEWLHEAPKVRAHAAGRRRRPATRGGPVQLRGRGAG
ncbi:2-alkenal reductase, partial [Mitsuaria sp. TWR114]